MPLSELFSFIVEFPSDEIISFSRILLLTDGTKLAKKPKVFKTVSKNEERKYFLHVATNFQY